MFSPIRILHQIPFLRLLVFLILGIALASIKTDVNLGLIFIIITLIISLICTWLPPNKSHFKGLVIMFSIITLGYFSVHIEKPTKQDSNVIEKLAQNTNSLFAKIFTTHLDTESSALCKALCIADKSGLESSTKKEFSRAGASHILAVSGMHVGIIFTAISTLLGLISKRRNYTNISNIVAIIFLWFYAFICGLQPSIVRACTMFTVPIIAKILHRDNISFNCLLFTAFCMLIYDYTHLFNIGFQLSFLAVAGILLFQEKIFNIFHLQNKILIWLWSLTSVSIAAQITTLPLTIYYFHNIPVLSLFSNLFVVPLATLLIYFSGIFLILSYFPNNHFIIFITNKLSHALTSIVKYFSDISFAVVEHIYISIFQVAILYLIILQTRVYISSKKPLHLMIILSLFILFLAYDIIYLLFM